MRRSPAIVEGALKVFALVRFPFAGNDSLHGLVLSLRWRWKRPDYATDPQKRLQSCAHEVRNDFKMRRMRNIQVIDGSENSVFDIFAATEEEFALIFPAGQDIAFIDEVIARGPEEPLNEAFSRIWKRRLPKRDAMGIHGLLFYELAHKKQYYPTRRDEEAVNPDGTRLR